METALNLVWLLTALVLVRLWVSPSPRSGLRLQLAALALLLVVLFPIISVTDDLQTVQASAETEGNTRRNHAAGAQHTAAPNCAAAPPPAFEATGLGQPGRCAIARQSALLPPPPPALRRLNRPPPAD